MLLFACFCCSAHFLFSIFVLCCDWVRKSVKKSFPILVTERWVRSWSLCTGSQPACDLLVIPGGRLPMPLLSTRPAVSFPAEERHRPSTSTKLYCLVTEAHRCEELSRNCYAADPGENRTHDLMIAKSNAVPLSHCATLVLIYDDQMYAEVQEISLPCKTAKLRAVL